MPKSVLPIAIVAFGMWSCVDKDYNLDKINTDDIVIGDELLVPLGIADITTGTIFDIDENSPIKSIAGNYAVQYSGDIPIEIPDVVIDNYTLRLPAVGLDGLTPGTYTLPSSFLSQLPSAEQEVDLPKSDNVTSLSRVDFSNTGATFTVTLNMSGLRINSGSGTLNIATTFPAEFEMSAKNLPAGATFNSTLRTLSYAMPISAGVSNPSATFSFNLKKAVFGAQPAKVALTSSLNLPAGTNVSVGASPSINLNGSITGMAFDAVYGKFNLDIVADEQSVAFDDLNDIFNEGNNVLSFADPRIKIETSSNIGIPLTASLKLTGQNSAGVKKQADINNLAIKAATSATSGPVVSKLWIGELQSSVTSGYDYVSVADKQLSNLIKIAPQNVSMSMKVNTGSAATMFFPKNAAASASYMIDIPLSAAPDFRASVTQNIDDVFDKDMVDYLFSSGEVVIMADVSNGIPLKLKMGLVITDGEDKPVGISMPQQDVASATTEPVVSKVSFPIGPNDIPKMKSARNIKIVLDIQGGSGATIRDDQSAKLTLKIKKKGGISID